MEQISIFDYMADNIPQMPLSQKIKYIGVNKKDGFINGNTYKARYKIENNNIQFIKEMFLKIGLMVKEELMWNISNFDSVPVNSEDYSGVGRTVNDSRQRVYLFQQRILNEHTVVIGHKELLNLFGDIRTIYEAVFVATIDGCQSEISIFDGDIISIQGDIEDFL